MGTFAVQNFRPTLMPGTTQTNISTFFIAGINYRKTDADLRGQYAVNNEQYANLLALAPQYGLGEFFVLSTCNRTEIYGFSESVAGLCKLLCTQTQGSLETFYDIAYIKNGQQAIQHFFDVAAGLDSQILGDYEIVGQIKQAVKFSKKHGFVGAYMERLVNAVLQSSKLIKTTTGLSGGTVSVAFAAIQYIKERVADVANKKILLVGTGKIGRNICKNLIDYLGTKNITLINRTESKAAELAAELGLQYAAIETLSEKVMEADVVFPLAFAKYGLVPISITWRCCSCSSKAVAFTKSFWLITFTFSSSSASMAVLPANGRSITTFNCFCNSKYACTSSSC